MQRMNSQNLHQIQGIASEALLDRLEHEMLALTAAALDEQDERPRQIVDEFAPEFLLFRSSPS